MYDYVFLTPLPAFYKVNLYNEISKSKKIFIIFLSDNTVEKRSNDFSGVNNSMFDYMFLNTGDFQARNKLISIIKLNSVLKKIQYKKIILGGWDLLESWSIVFTTTKNKNCFALESTIIESQIVGIKGLIKKLFLSRISTVFASGLLHVELLKALHFKGEIKITHGVGIINKPKFEIKEKTYQKRFLYLGRLSRVKNLQMLIEIFNDLTEYTLIIVGDGLEKEALKSMAKVNIVFKPSIENKNLKDEFFKNDILVLPSISETWGLVTEEALYFGMPVIISENCGSSELIENGVNGFIINPLKKNISTEIIKNIDEKTYRYMRDNISKNPLEEKDHAQIDAYIKLF